MIHFKVVKLVYKKMADYLEERCVGDFCIKKFTVTDKDLYSKIRCGISNGTYVKLEKRGSIIMSDTDMEKRTNYQFCNNAHGDVLIGGLGIGMIVLAIQDNPMVDSITILEKYPEVIQLVGEQLPLNKKVQIVNADVFEWKPSKGRKFDCIYMDIWDYINSGIYSEEMLPLIRKYAHYLTPKKVNPNSFVTCWCKKEAKNNERI